MSDLSANDTPRPVSIVTIAAIFVLFAAFLIAAHYIYMPKHTGSFSGDGIRTAQQREDILIELRKKQTELATKYGWVDQKAGVVRLPVERAIDLTVQQYGTKK